VATLCQQYVGAFGLLPPVAADKGVRKVVVANRLCVSDCEHLTNGPTLDQLAHLQVGVGVAEDVADGADRTVLLTGLC